MTTEITMSEKQTQQKKILDYLRTGASLTPIQALDVAGTMKLSTRVGELIRKGYPIIKEWYQIPKGRKVMSSRLATLAV